MLRSASEPQRPASLTPGNAASLSSTSADAGETASFLRSAQPELLSTDEMEDGGWSSGFDDSDDDMIGGTF